MDNPMMLPCKKCRLLFGSEEELLSHRLSSSQHLICKHCYEEFVSEGGLKEHVRSLHPIDQDISCKCGQHFNRAAGLIAHLENKECPGSQPGLNVREIQDMLRHTTIEEPDSAKWKEAKAKHEKTNPKETEPEIKIKINRPAASRPAASRPAASWATGATATGAYASSVVNQAYDSGDSDNDLMVFDRPYKAPVFGSGGGKSTSKKNYESPNGQAKTEGKRSSSYASAVKGRGKRVSGNGESWNIHMDQPDIGAANESRTEIPGHDAAFGSSSPALKPIPQPNTKPASTATPKEKVKPAFHPDDDPDMWKEDKSLAGWVDMSTAEIMEKLKEAAKVKAEEREKNPFHPTCPTFKVSDYWNKVLGVYVCPHTRCIRTKPNKATFIQHLCSAAHQDDRITCYVCNGIYSSPTAYAQHFESQGKKCRAREIAGSAITNATGGIIKIVGENPDSTNRYAAWLNENHFSGDLVSEAIFNNMIEKEEARQREDMVAKFYQANVQW